MKAVVYHKYGAPDVLCLEEKEKPIPRADQVLIKVYASSINSWDWDALRGNHFVIRLVSGLFSPRNKILGADVAGVVEAVGDKVKGFKPGDAVYGDIAGAGFGAFAEYVCAPEKLLAHKPSSMSFEQAAALPQAGLLALQGLRYKGDVEKGQELLINGAGGGVGPLALQYAKMKGADVTCVDRKEKFGPLKALGADHLIDYTEQDYTKTGKQYDRILDVTAKRSISEYKRALKPGGVFAMIGGSMGWLLVKLMLFAPLISFMTGKKMGLMGYRPNRADLDYISKIFEEGYFSPLIDSTFSLEEVPAAFRYFERGSFKGKIVISVAQT